MKRTEDMTARYEYRIWAESLGDLKGRLRRSGGTGRVEASEEIYLIADASNRCNAKIRGGLMDIKMLIGTERGLEQWQPVLKASFPIEAAIIAEQIFSRLELAEPRLAKAQYQTDEFLNHLIRAEAGIAIVQVAKTRTRFAIKGCMAEFSAVMINDGARETVAAESGDADAVLELMRELGIEGGANTSYVREIKRVLGKEA